MLDFILSMCFIAFFVFFPYKKVYLWLSYYVDVKLLLGAVLLISIRFIYGVFRPESGEAPPAALADSKNPFDRMNVTLSSFADAFGWICLFTGIVILLFLIWQAVESGKEKQKQLSVNNKDE
ncbi:hypothetical protein [Pantoea ananatis]|uniref:hypothetical protein n=1 Tax=Pantoea ananas TaxID=553 RepID=UPI001B305A3C|nr:hypothetical protein [Pantoea ananatis]